MTASATATTASASSARAPASLSRARHDWNDPVYREWIRWNYERRLEIWDLNNRTAQSAGGPDCLWVGMNSGSVSGQSRSFRDLKEICKRAQIIMLDHQARSEAVGFQQNGDTGKLIHSLLGWDKLIPESMAMYQNGRTNFRVAAKPAAEARMWMIEGFAGGIQPWWHHVGAYHEDRRTYLTAEPVMRWHKASEEFLVNRRPVATVGLLWSQQNTDFYGRDAADELVDQPYRGMMQALIRARIPYLPLHADYIDRDAARSGGAHFAQPGRHVGCAVRRGSPIRRARRRAVCFTATARFTTNRATRVRISRSPACLARTPPAAAGLHRARPRLTCA